MRKLTNIEFKTLVEFINETEINFEHTLDGKLNTFDLYSDDDMIFLNIKVGVKENGILTPANRNQPAEFERTSLEVSVIIVKVWIDEDIAELSIKQDQDLTELITKIVRL